jgi:hypothetical protein
MTKPEDFNNIRKQTYEEVPKEYITMMASIYEHFYENYGWSVKELYKQLLPQTNETGLASYWLHKVTEALKVLDKGETVIPWLTVIENGEPYLDIQKMEKLLVALDYAIEHHLPMVVPDWAKEEKE